MGKFDDTIAWLKERLDIAREDLDEMQLNQIKQFRNGQDITGELMERTTNDIQRFEALITAYESQNV